MSQQAKDIMARHVAWARTQIGRTEHPSGSNHVRITINGRDQDLWSYIKPSFQGEPWCAAFQTVGYLQQGVDLRTLFADGNSFYCPSIEAMARKRGVWHNVGSGYDPKTGDLSLMHNPGVGHATHIECAAPDSSNYSGFRQIGGNTSPSNKGSQNNGGGVWLRDRQPSGIRGWVDMESLIDQMIHEGKVKGATAHAATPTGANHVQHVPVIARGWRRVDAPYAVDKGSVGNFSAGALHDAMNRDIAARDGVKGHTPAQENSVRIFLEALRRIGLVDKAYADRRICGTTAQAAFSKFVAWVGPSHHFSSPMTTAQYYSALEMLFFDSGINGHIVP